MNKNKYFTGIVFFLSLCLSNGQLLKNPDFERDFDGNWNISSTGINIVASTNQSFNRNQSCRFTGVLPNTPSTNSISQTVLARKGDKIVFRGYVNNNFSTDSGDARIQVTLDGPFNINRVFSQRLADLSPGWHPFEVSGSTIGVVDGDFESPSLFPWWTTSADFGTIQLNTNSAYAGKNALHFVASWGKSTANPEGWNWMEAFQTIELKTGDIVEGECMMNAFLSKKTTNDAWLVAGIKLEHESNSNLYAQNVLDHDTPQSELNQWKKLKLYYKNSNEAGIYKFRAMVCGKLQNWQANVLFDNISIRKSNDTTPEIFPVKATACIINKNNSSGQQIDVYFDSFKLTGASAQAVSPELVYDDLQKEAKAMGASTPFPTTDYPPLYAYGYPGNDRENVRYPARIAAFFSGYSFMELTNMRPLQVTNRIEVYRLDNKPAELAIDYIALVAKEAHLPRFSPPNILTNAPYFQIGSSNGSSAEFKQSKSFAHEFTYYIGSNTPSQFPARLSTESDGWPSVVNIVFDVPTNHWKVFTNYMFSRHTIIASVCPDAITSANKAVKVALQVESAKLGLTNLMTQELHFGRGTPEECYAHFDYPSVTYNGHNNFDLRRPWSYNALDAFGYYVAPESRGNDVIEPVEIYCYDLYSSNWVNSVYEEYIYNLCNSGSLVRELGDDDYTYRIPGVAAYDVGYKIGHKSPKLNSLGTYDYPILRSERGNGYSRYAAYGGAMGGSYRVMAQNPFSLYPEREDYARLLISYVQLIPPDPFSAIPAFCRTYSLYASKSNQLFSAVVRCDYHADPAEALTNGITSEVDVNVYMKKDMDWHSYGPLGLLGQSSMHWRESSPGEEGLGAHDINRVTVYNPNAGEWFTFRISNPSNSVRHASICSLETNSVVYLLQTERRHQAFQKYKPEIPYSAASGFIFEFKNVTSELLFQSLPKYLDVNIQRTRGETDDNVVINPVIKANIQKDDCIKIGYNYKVVNTPGVNILPTLEWVGDVLHIQVVASDQDNPLQASLFYGSGHESEWIPVSTNVDVPTNSDYQLPFLWETEHITPGYYYLKVVANRSASSGMVGFDVTSTRMEVGGYAFSNNISTDLWQPLTPKTHVNTSSNTTLALTAKGTGLLSGSLQAMDSSGVIETVELSTLGTQRLFSEVQQFNLPLSFFHKIDRSHLKSFKIVNSLSGMKVTGFRTRSVPLSISTSIQTPPALNKSGMPHYNAGDTVVNLISISNLTDHTLPISIRVIQEYASDSTWIERIENQPDKTSYNHHAGDRFEGDAESNFSLAIPGSAVMTITNRYIMPVGLPKGSGFVFRNDPGVGRHHITISSGGKVIIEEINTGLFSTDDNFDEDDNSLPDSWELKYFGSRTGTDPNADPDKDGLSNLEEYLSGLNPHMAETRFKLTIEKGNSNAVVVSHDAVPGRFYLLTASDGIGRSNLFTAVFSNQASGTMLTYTNDANLNKELYFHGVELKTPPPILVNGDFETGRKEPYSFMTDRINIDIASSPAHEGSHSIGFSGTYTNWAFNMAYQKVYLHAGVEIEYSGFIFADKFESSATNCLAGIKIENVKNPKISIEETVNPLSPKKQWTRLRLVFTPPESGDYLVGCFVAGGVANSVTSANIFFDDLALGIQAYK